ncbi:MAG: GAF domain-containing protein [Novosphingobium sp.]|nr:GAF domain-containing protein [Novosphingobium sp.]
MFDFAPRSGFSGKADLYADLADAARAITRDEPDAVANMANLAALIWQFLPDLNWAGFYRAIGGELVLGPFIGKPACIRIAWGQGVCGAAARTGQTQIVPDVHTFPGHIACDSASRSELVVPVIRNGAAIAVIDLDSPLPARFDKADAAGVEMLAAIAATAMNFPAQSCSESGHGAQNRG